MEIISFLRGALIWCYLKWGDVFIAFCTKQILSSFSTGFLCLLSEGQQGELKHGGAVSWVCITVTHRLHLKVPCCVSHCSSQTHAESVRTRTQALRQIDHSQFSLESNSLLLIDKQDIVFCKEKTTDVNTGWFSSQFGLFLSGERRGAAGDSKSSLHYMFICKNYQVVQEQAHKNTVQHMASSFD